MADCPPGTVLNPRTLRCISATGRIAQELVRSGDLREATVAAAVQPARHINHMCPPNSVRNPATSRCVRVGGRTYMQLGLAQQPQQHRPALAESAVAPNTMDRNALLRWASSACRNRADALTRQPFINAETTALRSIVQLHDRTCALAPALHQRVVAEHHAGRIATTPDGEPLQLDDFRVLRDAMRRTDPTYRLPPRRHQPPPPTWQLYVASDERSGPEYVSVLYVDVTRGYRTEAGTSVYPPSAIRVNLGFLPIEIPPTARCDIATLVEALRLLAEANRLLVPVAGGWKPIGGLPHDKAYWATDRATKVSRLCRELMRALTLPM